MAGHMEGQVGVLSPLRPPYKPQDLVQAPRPGAVLNSPLLHGHLQQRGFLLLHKVSTACASYLSEVSDNNLPRNTCLCMIAYDCQQQHSEGYSPDQSKVICRQHQIYLTRQLRHTIALYRTQTLLHAHTLGGVSKTRLQTHKHACQTLAASQVQRFGDRGTETCTSVIPIEVKIVNFARIKPNLQLL